MIFASFGGENPAKPLSCLPMTSTLPVYENGDFGGSPFCGQPSGVENRLPCGKRALFSSGEQANSGGRAAGQRRGRAVTCRTRLGDYEHMGCSYHKAGVSRCPQHTVVCKTTPNPLTREPHQIR